MSAGVDNVLGVGMFTQRCRRVVVVIVANYDIVRYIYAIRVDDSVIDGTKKHSSFSWNSSLKWFMHSNANQAKLWREGGPWLGIYVYVHLPRVEFPPISPE